MWIPWDLKGAKKKRLRRKALLSQNPSLLQLQTLGPPLPNLHSIVVLPCLTPSPSPEALRLHNFLHPGGPFGLRLPLGDEYRASLLDETTSHASALQYTPFQDIEFDRSAALLHHPLILQPQHTYSLSPAITVETWIVDCGGMDATSLGEALDGNVRWLLDPWDPSPFIIPWNEGSVVWTGMDGVGMRACARHWAELGNVDEEFKGGWKFMMKDGSTRPFFEEESEGDRDLW